MNVIQPGHTRATILASRTPTRGNFLDRGIADRVARTRAALPLKNMKEAKPMPDLVRRRAALVVVRHAAAGHAAGEDVATVLVVGAAAGGGVGGEVADAEEAAAEVGEEVDVEAAVGAFAQGGLHLRVVVARGPVVVYGEVRGDEGEGDAAWSIRAVEDCELWGC